MTIRNRGWRRWLGELAAVATILGLIVTIISLFAPRDKGASNVPIPSPSADPHQSAVPAIPIPTGPDANAAATSPSPSDPPVLLKQQVDLDRYTAVDVDNGHIRYPLKQGAAGVDLYLDWGYILYSSVLHSDMYDDTHQGGETGAYDRCANYRQLGQRTSEHEYIGAGMQFCITTSDGYPGWIQINSIPIEKPGGAILKVIVWQK